LKPVKWIKLNFGKPDSEDDDTLTYKHQDGFNVSMRRGVKSLCLNVIPWDEESWNAHDACV